MLEASRYGVFLCRRNVGKRVILGTICIAVSLRTLAGSSSGPVALFWFRFSN